MLRSDFQKMMLDEVGLLVDLNNSKGRDYEPEEDDVLSFFKEMTSETGMTEEQIWSVLARKHWSAILSYVKNHREDGYSPSEPVDGRIRDLILYLFLLLGIVSDVTDARDGFSSEDLAALRKPENLQGEASDA